jgi:hypothetical protein
MEDFLVFACAAGLVVGLGTLACALVDLMFPVDGGDE